jgi:hypothetical protein
MLRMKILGGLIIAVLFVFGCDNKDQKAAQEDLTIVVEADRSKISEEERKLKDRMGAFEEERKKLRKEKAELMKSKEDMKGKDKVQERRLVDMEKKLWQRERDMWERETAIEKERGVLAKQKSSLLNKISKVPIGGGEKTIEQREQNIAFREKSLSAREKDLASREQELAQRETDLAKREAAFLKMKSGQLVAQIPVASVITKPEKQVSQKKVEREYRNVRAKMRKRGILAGDLPLEYANLISQIKKQKSDSDFSGMMDTVNQLKAIVKSTVVDASFIDGKFNRLAKLRSKKQPNEQDKQAVASLLKKATRSYGDGKFARANKELNKIFALLNK